MWQCLRIDYLRILNKFYNFFAFIEIHIINNYGM